MSSVTTLEKLRRTNIVPGLTFNSTAAAAANTTLIQGAIDALASAGSNEQIILPGGVIFTNKLIRRGSVGIRGQGERATILRLADGANTDLLVDERYEENVLFAQPPFVMSDLTLDGNKAANSAGSVHIFQSFDCTFENLRIMNGAEHGQVLTTVVKSGSEIGNNVADNSYRNVRYTGNNFAGYYARNAGSNRLADQLFDSCIWELNGNATWAQCRVERTVGFVWNACRMYSAASGGDMRLSLFGVSQILNGHFELDGRNSPNTSTIIPSIRISSWTSSGDRFGIISNNVFWMRTPNKSATDIYCAVYFDQASENLVLSNNVFRTSPSIAVKRAVHGALNMGGERYPNTFSGYTVGAEYGDSWNNWGTSVLPAAATDAATTQTLANAVRTLLINQGVTR